LKLTPSQQEVVDCTEAEILVTAGAGSGKTSTTVERYIALLGREPEPLDLKEILVFTFTDKAAGELRERVRDALRRKVEREGGTPGSVSMSDAWVGTFHAICNRILKAWPVEAGIDPGFTVLDSTSTETVTGAAFDRAVEEFCSSDPKRAELIGLFGIEALRGTIAFAYDELRSRGIETPRLPDFEPTGFPAAEERALRQLVDDALAGEQTENRKKRLEDLVAILKRRDYGHLRYGNTLGLTARSNEQLVAIEEAHKAFCDAMARHMADPVRRQLGELLEIFGVTFSRAKAARSALDYEDLQLFTLRLLREHEHIRTAYQQRFREIMVDEYQDTNGLQVELISLLKGEGTTLTTVGDEMQSIYRFRHADVELFRRRREADEVRTIELRKNFRSQPGVISAINLLGTALDGQVRTKRGADADRHLFSKLEPGLKEEDGVRASVSLILTEHDGWKPLELGELAPAIPPEAEVGKDDDHFNEAEALALAHHLRDLVDEPDNGVTQGDIAILLRAKTRTQTYVNALRQAGLVPYVVSGGGFWKTREAIELKALLSVVANPLDDNQLLGALTSPACGISTDALWLLRRAGEPYQPLWPALSALASGDQPNPTGAEWLTRIRGDDRERAVRFVDTINSLRRRSVTMSLAELIEASVTETGYDLANLIRDPSANGYAAIRRAESLAREYEAAEGRSLRGFLDWATLSEKLDSEGAAATADESSDVVRVMTIHAAKGLQFKVTCVPDLGRQCKSRHDHAIRLGPSSKSDPLDFDVGVRVPQFDGGKVDAYSWEMLKEAERLATEDEELRLLHVAITRAENHLVLSGVLPKKWPERQCISEACPMIVRSSVAFGLDPEAPEDWDELIPFDSSAPGKATSKAVGGIRVIHNAATEERAAELRRTRPPTAVPEAESSGAPPLHRPQTRVYPDVPLSFTAFAEFAECPARFYARRVLKVRSPGEWARPADPSNEPLSGRSRGTRFGSAVHDVLEQLAGSGWRMPASKTVEQALVRQGLTPGEVAPGDLVGGEGGPGDLAGGDVETAAEMVSGFLESELGKRVAGPGSSAEVPLILRHGNVTIRGSADLVHESIPPLLLDYKTNRLEGSSASEKMKAYELQRGLYALALARARGLETVETAYVFLEQPDEPLLKTYGRKDFEAVEQMLTQTLSEITAGRFFGGPDARFTPCGEADCPGCGLLAAQIERASLEAA
jgi:ATP-dependent exoDNAse (exonuclease V) beta subunit